MYAISCGCLSRRGSGKFWGQRRRQLLEILEGRARNSTHQIYSASIGSGGRSGARKFCLKLIHFFLLLNYFHLQCCDSVLFALQLRSRLFVIFVFRLAQVHLFVEGVLPLENVEVSLKAFQVLFSRVQLGGDACEIFGSRSWCGTGIVSACGGAGAFGCWRLSDHTHPVCLWDVVVIPYANCFWLLFLLFARAPSCIHQRAA